MPAGHGTHATSVDEPLARISTDFSNAIAEVSLGHELEYLAAHPAHLAALAISCGAVYYIVTRGRQKIRRLKAEFLSHGIDLTNVDDRLDTLTYLKKMQDQGMLPLGLEVCAMKQAEMEVLFMGNDGIAKWKKYYAERGIDIESAGDLDRVRKYVENARSPSKPQRKRVYTHAQLLAANGRYADLWEAQTTQEEVVPFPPPYVPSTT